MYGLVDFHGTQESTTEGYPGLSALADQLIGERLLFARRGYPDELKLHLGTPIETPGPKGRTIIRGSYVLGAAASAWRFKIAGAGVTVYSGDPFPPLFPPHAKLWTRPLEEANLDKLLTSTGGATVVGLDIFTHPYGYGLWLSLSDASVLTIIPTPPLGRPADTEGDQSAEAPLAPIPDWELFTPYNRFLRAGPGLTWAYLPSNEPESRQPKNEAAK